MHACAELSGVVESFFARVLSQQSASNYQQIQRHGDSAEGAPRDRTEQ